MLSTGSVPLYIPVGLASGWLPIAPFSKLTINTGLYNSLRLLMSVCWLGSTFTVRKLSAVPRQPLFFGCMAPPFRSLHRTIGKSAGIYGCVGEYCTVYWLEDLYIGECRIFQLIFPFVVLLDILERYVGVKFLSFLRLCVGMLKFECWFQSYSQLIGANDA